MHGEQLSPVPCFTPRKGPLSPQRISEREMGLLLDAFELRPTVDFCRGPIEPLSCLEEDVASHDWCDSDSDSDYDMDVDEDSDCSELIWDGVASTVRKIDDVRVVKSAPTFKKYVPEPHDILKECSILSSLSHPNVSGSLAVWSWRIHLKSR
jgi:hypothetical protein